MSVKAGQGQPPLDRLRGLDIGHTARDGRAGEAGRPGDRRHATPPDGQRLGPGKQPAGPLVEQPGDPQEPRSDGCLVDHPPIIPYR